MTISDAPISTPHESTEQTVCTKCGHDNTHARLSKTLFRRRVFVSCFHQDDAVTGMAGTDVCLCRGESHHVITAEAL